MIAELEQVDASHASALQVWSARYDFLAREQEADMIRTIALPQVRAFFAQHLAPSSPTRRKLCVHIIPQRPGAAAGDPSFSAAAAAGVANGATAHTEPGAVDNAAGPGAEHASHSGHKADSEHHHHQECTHLHHPQHHDKKDASSAAADAAAGADVPALPPGVKLVHVPDLDVLKRSSPLYPAPSSVQLLGP